MYPSDSQSTNGSGDDFASERGEITIKYARKAC